MTNTGITRGQTIAILFVMAAGLFIDGGRNSTADIIPMNAVGFPWGITAVGMFLAASIHIPIGGRMEEAQEMAPNLIVLIMTGGMSVLYSVTILLGNGLKNISYDYMLFMLATPVMLVAVWILFLFSFMSNIGERYAVTPVGRMTIIEMFKASGCSYAVSALGVMTIERGWEAAIVMEGILLGAFSAIMMKTTRDYYEQRKNNDSSDK